MIRHFERPDIRRIKTNSFSDMGELSYVIDDPDFIKQTLVGEDSAVYAIICFKKYWNNNYMAFFLIAEDMPVVHARELKQLLYNGINDLGADRVQTDSEACPVIDRWHKFLGFTCEGTREKMIFDKDYRLWALLRGRDF